jgi:GAF domain-containing protein
MAQQAITLFNLLATGVALWLGLYIITRSYGSRLSRIAALALWAMAGILLYRALAVSLPDSEFLRWLRPVAIFGLPLWFHLTTELAPPRGGRLVHLRRRWAVPMVYSLTGLLAAGAFPLAPAAQRPVGPLFLYLLAFVFAVGSLSVANLWQGRRAARDLSLRRLYGCLIALTAIAYLGGAGLGVSVWARAHQPTFPELPIFLFNFVCGASVLLVGYSVAKYNAFVEGRTIERDALYSLLGIGSVAALYGLFALLLYWDGQATFLTLVLVLILAIISHALYEGGRAMLDRLFYHGQLQQLRINLRSLAREAGTSHSLSGQLQAILNNLCQNLSVHEGFVALRSEDHLVVAAARMAGPVGQSVPAADLAATEIVKLAPPGAAHLPHMALLVPLIAGEEQLGALVLGAKHAGQAYSEADLTLLETLSGQLAAVIQAAQLQEQNAGAINQMVADFRRHEQELQQQIQQMLTAQHQQECPAATETADEDSLASTVERCLQQFHDYTFLGNQPLARLAIVEQELIHQRSGNGDHTLITQVDRGRVLHELLLRAIYKLRPHEKEPDRYQIPQRSWYPFIVLHESYVRNELIRDTTSRLAFSEATFHRVRRRAVQSIAQMILEMEQNAQGALTRTSNGQH